MAVMSKISFWFFATIGLITVYSCRDDINLRNDLVMNGPGVIELEPSEMSARISIEDNLVVLKISTPDGGLLVRNQDASAIHKWRAFWEKEALRFWLASADVGIIVWSFSKEGVIEQRVRPDTTELLQAVPDAIAEFKQGFLKKSAQQSKQIITPPAILGSGGVWGLLGDLTCEVGGDEAGDAGHSCQHGKGRHGGNGVDQIGDVEEEMVDWPGQEISQAE